MQGGRTWTGVWRLIDPKISLASFASMLVGACAAGRDGPISWPWLAVTVVGILALEIAKNASGEIVDFDSGADLGVAPEDRSPFSGGKRVLVDRLLTRGQTIAVAIVGYGLGTVCGLLIARERTPEVLTLGAAGVALAFFYHAPPLKLAYRGLGEVAVGLAYGPMICAGTYLVQRGTLPLPVLLLASPLGLAILAFLWINEFPDYHADRAAGKRNLVVRLGRVPAARAFVALQAVVFTGQGLLPLAGFPRDVWLAGFALPFAADACRRILADPELTARVVPAQRSTLISFVVLAIGSGAGLCLS